MVLSACERETTWRQRLTIVIETPSGEVRGSSVTKIIKTETNGTLVPPEARGVRSSVIGEAIAIEVAQGRYLFALLSGSGEEKRDATHWVYPVYNLSEAESFADAMRIVTSQPYDDPVPLPEEAWPMLVTFDDAAEPESVKRVDPNDLAGTFGPNVRLKAITLEITESEVTEGLTTKVLPWVCAYRAGALRLNGQSGAVFVADKSLSNMLGAGSLLRGDCQ